MDNINWQAANYRRMFSLPSKMEPKVDEVVSKVVGKKIFQHDPRLIKLIVKWKGNKPEDSTKPDNFLDDPKKVDELKKALNIGL